MGDGDGGLSGADTVNGLGDETLGLGIHGGGGLVEDEQGRIEQQGSRDGDTLALTAGQRAGADTYHGIVALGEAEDEVVGVGGLGGRDHLGTGRLGIGVADVVHDGAAEDVDLLGYDGHVAAEGVHLDILDVHAVNGDGAADGVVHTGDEVGNGGFTRAGVSHQTHVVALLDGEGDILQNGTVGAVVEVHVVEYDLAFNGFQTDGVGSLGNLGNLIQHLEHTHGGVHGVGHHIGEVGKEVQGAEDHARVAHVHRQLTVGHGLAHHLNARKAPHGVAGSRHQDGDDGEDEHSYLLGAEVGVVELGGVLIEAAGLGILLGKGLDHADARQGVVHHGVHGGGAAPQVGVGLPQLGQGEFQDQHHGEDGGVENEGQLPVHGEEQDGQHHVGQHAGDEVGHTVDEEAADALGVVVDAVDELTRGVAVEVGERQPLHGAEDVVLHVAGHAGGQVGVGAVLDDTEEHGQ